MAIAALMVCVTSCHQFTQWCLMLWDWRLVNFPVAWHYHGYSQIKKSNRYSYTSS
uniref:Uncharacterized protein n=1 Tax=Anguilla anguilla TaxID=7936 RepID=A0A0E9UK71_ANGAN